MPVELIEISNGVVYYVCDQSVLGDAPPQRSNSPSHDEQPDTAFLTQDEGYYTVYVPPYKNVTFIISMNLTL